jgi:hypothetical protein
MASGKLFPRPAKVTISIGKPIHPGEKDYDEIVRNLYEQVVKLLKAG